MSSKRNPRLRVTNEVVTTVTKRERLSKPLLDDENGETAVKQLMSGGGGGKRSKPRIKKRDLTALLDSAEVGHVSKLPVRKKMKFSNKSVEVTVQRVAAANAIKLVIEAKGNDVTGLEPVEFHPETIEEDVLIMGGAESGDDEQPTSSTVSHEEVAEDNVAEDEDVTTSTVEENEDEDTVEQEEEDEDNGLENDDN